MVVLGGGGVWRQWWVGTSHNGFTQKQAPNNAYDKVCAARAVIGHALRISCKSIGGAGGGRGIEGWGGGAVVLVGLYGLIRGGTYLTVTLIRRARLCCSQTCLGG